jgi:tRNA-binding protein
MTIEWGDFERIELRIGTVVKAEHFEGARKPALKVWVDLGDLGIKKSSAQITQHYQPETLIGKRVMCVCNFAPKQICNFMSEVLITGFPDENGHIVLATVDKAVPNGARLF